MDPIADMLTRIRNAALAHLKEVVIPYSNIKIGIAKILQAEGFLEDVRVPEQQKKMFTVTLRYNGNDAVLQELKRVSTPGRRVYQSYRALPRTVGAYGVAIVSTSQGIMTHREAKKRKLGGEVLCEIT